MIFNFKTVNFQLVLFSSQFFSGSLGRKAGEGGQNCHQVNNSNNSSAACESKPEVEKALGVFDRRLQYLRFPISVLDLPGWKTLENPVCAEQTAFLLSPFPRQLGSPAACRFSCCTL